MSGVHVSRAYSNGPSRAYIAASRRSDRSLEARIESARRASEIHKRRTGRALRVTESDVVNEEMYEEEDDDVTHAYRNLGMLMGGNSIDRRFAAYYQHQMHMRNIVDRALQERIARSEMNVACGPNLYSSDFSLQQQRQQQYPFYMQTVDTPQMQTSYRQQPYFVPGGHGRTMSINIPPTQNVGAPQPSTPGTPSTPGAEIQTATNLHLRHMSAPTIPVSPSSDGQVQAPMSAGIPATSYNTSPGTLHLPSPESDGDNPYSLFPLTDELPAETTRYFAGQLQSANGVGVLPFNVDLFGQPTTYSKPQGYIPHLSPFQQDDSLEPKFEDNQPSEQWQNNQLDPPFSPANTVNGSLSADYQQNEFIDLFDNTSLLPLDSLDGLKLEDGSIPAGHLPDSLLDPTIDQDTWDRYMNQDWLDASHS
jgi:hypothetical protein